MKSFWFGLQWLLATLCGFFFSLCLVEIGERGELSNAEAVLGAAVVGLAQSLVLSQRIAQAWLWPLATALGWGLISGFGIGAIGWVAPRTEIISLRLEYGLVFGAICGALLGTMQWFVLKRQVFRSWHWILMSSFSWAIALAVGWSLGGILRLQTNLFLGEVIGLLFTWIVVGVFTGIALISILHWIPRRKMESR